MVGSEKPGPASHQPPHLRGWAIRGTVRSTSNASKMDPLKATLGDDLFSQMELVEADLLDATSLANAISGSTYVVHTASPFVLNNPEDP